jgi:hypothetical protein
MGIMISDALIGFGFRIDVASAGANRATANRRIKIFFMCEKFGVFRKLAQRSDRKTIFVWLRPVERWSNFWLLVTGYWLLVTGYWLLVTGYWLLVTGF